MKKAFFLTLLLFAFVAARPAQAQLGGCTDASPENPTLILGGLAAGAFGVSSLRTRLAARRFQTRRR